MDGPLSVRSSSLTSDLTGGIASLLNSEVCADLLIDCGTGMRSVHCHSIVLHMRCPLLLKQIQVSPSTVDPPDQTAEEPGAVDCGWKTSRLCLVNTPLPLVILEAVLEYAYRDRLSDSIGPSVMGDVLRAARSLQLPRLGELCEQSLHHDLTPASAAETLALADRAGSERLVGACLAFIEHHLDEVVVSEDFAALPPRLAADVFVACFAEPLVPAVQCGAISDEVIIELAQRVGPYGVGETDGGAGASADLDEPGASLFCTALEAALWCNREGVQRWERAELLLRLGVSIHRSGLLPSATLLHACLTYITESSVCEGVLRWLVGHGADLNLPDAQGNTALDCGVWVGVPRTLLQIMISMGRAQRASNPTTHLQPTASTQPAPDPA